MQAAIVALYLFATGPIAALEWNAVALDSGLYDAAGYVYKPLNWMCDRSDVLTETRDDWRRWWTTDAPWK